MQGYKSGLRVLYQRLTILIFLFILLLFSKVSSAATINATSCSASDVQAAINSATYGDTVAVPAGSCTWASRLSITKGIMLQGAGSGITIIKGNYTYSNGDDGDPLNYLISYVPDATSRTNDTPFRLMGFTVDPDNKCGAVLIRNIDGTIVITKVRVDHNIIQNPADIKRVIAVRGNVYGVIDNNTFNGPTSGVAISSPGADTNSWNNFTYVHGGANKLYYEDNTFNVYDEVMDSVAASRYVSRYNTFNILSSGFTTLFDLHGTQGGTSETASMGGEFYGNKVNGTVYRLLYHWGGRALAFYNKTTAGSFGITEHIYALDNASTNKPTRCGTSYGFTYNEECGTSDGLPEHPSDSYFWNNRNGSGSLITVSIGTTQIYTPGNVTMPVHDAQFWKHDSSFNGTSGMGCGTHTSRPATCTAGVGYWATDQSCSIVDDAHVGANPTAPISGTLYKCTATNTWIAYYTPYAYPHPLTTSGDTGGNTPPPSSGSGGESTSSGGSGCGFVRDDGKEQGAKGEGLLFAIMLIIALAGIILIKRYSLILRITFLIFLLPIDSYAATLEVGAGKTYFTIQAAVDAASAGDTVLVYAGTYNQSNSYSFAGTRTTIVHVKTSGTANNPIVIKAAESGAILDGGGVITNCFWGRDLSYIVIDGFSCTNVNVESATSAAGAIHFWQSSYITIQNNNIYNIIASDPENKAAIMATMSNSTIKNNAISTNSVGIAGGMSGYTFGRNTIDGNVINGNSVGSGTYFSQSADDYIIRNNYIYNYGLAGIQVRDSYRAKIYKNVVYKGNGAASNSWISYAFNLRDWPHSGPATDCNEDEQYEVYNNVVDDATYAFALTQMNNSVFKNNIAVNVNYVYIDTEWSGGGGKCQIGVKPSTGLTFDYNIYSYSVKLYDDDGDMGYIDGGHNLDKVDPKFVATGSRPCPYYELQQDSPARNAGSDGKDIGADACGTGAGNGNTPPPSDGGDTTTSNSDTSGGSGCGFVKDDGKGPRAKGEGLSFAIMLIITLAGIALSKRLIVKRREFLG